MTVFLRLFHIITPHGHLIGPIVHGIVHGDGTLESVPSASVGTTGGHGVGPLGRGAGARVGVPVGVLLGVRDGAGHGIGLITVGVTVPVGVLVPVRDPWLPIAPAAEHLSEAAVVM